MKDVKGLILSPGNIFWKQKSGKLVQVCTKADFLNLELIEKLFTANHELLIEDRGDLQVQVEFCEYFKNHNAEILVMEKNQWRKKLLSLFSTRMCSEDFTQFEINQMAWIVFSTIDPEKAKELLDEDIELFKRSMNIATSYTLIAFMLGHYSDLFLSKLYTDTFLDLMELDNAVPVYSLKTQLEKIRTLESWEDEDKLILASIYQLDQRKKLLIGERYDGSGIENIKKCEMTGLEMVLIALNEHYAYSGHHEKNIFCEIKNLYFKCDEKILKVLRKCLDVEAEKASASMNAS